MKNLHTLDKYRLGESERNRYGASGDSGNGCFKVFVQGRSFFVIASNGGGWDHVSVSYCNHKRQACPTWDEMCAIKNMFFDAEEVVVQYHPAKSQYVNNYPYCLHLWRPNDGTQFPSPPMAFV